MQSQDAGRVREIFCRVIEADVSERPAILERECVGAPHLRARVQDLLAAYRDAGEFLSTPTLDGDAIESTDGPPAAREDTPGTMLDRYRIVELLGEGGFGSVFLAQQEVPVRRQVALKIIKPGMDTKQVIARFEAERQALAMMEHPNIARVFDGGTTSAGRPYFAMELVRGVPITSYCDSGRLSTRQRMELFLSVCQAVQHAHQKGIIHRDLKPANVLVATEDGKPVPKVIDFGVAKAVAGESNGQTLLTEQRQFIGTPQYMSPEQAGGGGPSVDTRTDVYSLGALLYELLTGIPPFDPKALRTAAYDEVLRIIRESDPQRPSTRVACAGKTSQVSAAFRRTDPARLARSLKGELDWIVMRAMEKDPARRYDTASELGAELARYLAGEPVLAGPPGAAYRVRKFARRHRVALLAVAAIVLSLAVGLTVATIEAVHARRAGAEAVERLWNSYLAEARARRFSGRPGQRLEGLRVLQEAARIRPSLELRNEAIACLALPDVQPLQSWDFRNGDIGPTAFDPTFERYARASGGDLVIRRRADNHELVRFSHGTAVNALTFRFSPDGKLVFGVFVDSGSLRLWDASTGRLILERRLRGLGGADYSPDGSLLALVEPDETLALYALPEGRLVKTVPLQDALGRVRFAPDGRRMAVEVTDRRVQIISTDTGRLLTTLHVPVPADQIAWHPGGKRLAVCGGESDHRISVLDAATGQQLAVMRGHFAMPTSLWFSRQGDLLASGGWDATVRFWNPLNGRQLLLVEPCDNVFQFSSDESLLAHGHSGWVGVQRLVRSRECRFIYGPPEDSRYTSAQFSPDGKRLAAVGDVGVRFWDVETGESLGLVRVSRARSVIFTPDGGGVWVSVPEGVKRLPLPDGGPVELPPAGDNSSTGPLAVSHDGSTMIFATPDATVRAAHSDDMAHSVVLGRHRWAPRFADISPDGHWAATSTRHELGFKVWDLKTNALAGDLAASNHEREMGPAVFSPNGKWLVTGDTGAYTWWEAGSWRPHHRRERHGPMTDALAAFSPDGKFLAVAGDANDILLLDPETGQELASLSSPDPHRPWWVSFSPDGMRVVATSPDTLITVWDLPLIHSRLAELGLDWAPHPAP